MRTVMMLLALLCPSPDPPAPPAQLTPGLWACEWGAGEWGCTLGKDGTWTAEQPRTADSPGSRWEGSWSWDPKARELVVSERLPGAVSLITDPGPAHHGSYLEAPGVWHSARSDSGSLKSTWSI